MAEIYAESSVEYGISTGRRAIVLGKGITPGEAVGKLDVGGLGEEIIDIAV